MPSQQVLGVGPLGDPIVIIGPHILKEETHLLTGPFTRVPSPESQVTWGQPMQSQQLRAWKHMVPSPKSRVTWGQFVQSQPLRVWKHIVPSPKSQVTWGQSMQSQPLRAWKRMVPSPKSQVTWGWERGSWNLPLHMGSQASIGEIFGHNWLRS